VSKFYVRKREIHISVHEIEADTPEEALDRVAEGEEEEVEFFYLDTLDKHRWDVSDEAGNIVYDPENL
jgi:hypothetical protein